ncbi:MAG: hypothetical protein J6O50_03755 [Ruminiclostridium sp.]|nr:hypothetical protein [Ruminiclostridium sp.]
MSKIIDVITLGGKNGDISVLRLDKMPVKPYRRFLIGGKEYAPVPVFDTENCIAIEGRGNFKGEMVEFVAV